MFRECLKQVKEDRAITGTALSEATGLTNARISQFLNGKKDITATNLWVMLEGMEKISPGSLESFCLLLLGKSGFCLTEDKIADQIIALAKTMKKLQESKAGAK